MSSTFSSSSPPIGSEVGRWGSGIVEAIVKVQCVETSASLLGFLSKVKVIVAKVLGLWSSWIGWYPPTSKRGDFVESFCTLVNISGNFSM